MGMTAHRAGLLVLALGAAACRQTVVLDPGLQEGGFAPGGSGGGGFGGGAGRNDGRFDGGRDDAFPDRSFCLGGQLQRLSFSMRSPDVIISVDRSAAMQSWFGDGTRLQVIQQQVRSLIGKYQRVVRFGYQEFPSAGGNCPGSQGCCAGSVTPPTVGSYQTVDHAIHACDGNGAGCVLAQRPVADAIAKCSKTYSFFPNSAGSHYVILVLGGEPTCGGMDPSNSPCDNAVAEVAGLNRSSIGTAVVGVGDEAAGSACLDSLALAGGLDGGGGPPFYHLARSGNELSNALNDIVKTLAEEACHLDVQSPPLDPDRVALLFDGVGVPVDGLNGWTFDAGSSLKLTLHGPACDQLVSAQTHQIDLVVCAPQH
jgi:hypothetical protein